LKNGIGFGFGSIIDFLAVWKTSFSFNEFQTSAEYCRIINGGQNA